MANNNILENLFKKYSFLWGHYKLQNDCMERRRYFLWLLESALFVAWYKIFDKSKIIDFYSGLILAFGILLSIAWLFVSKRDRDSIQITEEQIRATENQWNELYKEIQLNRFMRDEEQFRCKYLTSQRFWLDHLIPALFIIIWIFLLIKTRFFP